MKKLIAHFSTSTEEDYTRENIARVFEWGLSDINDNSPTIKGHTLNEFFGWLSKEDCVVYVYNLSFYVHFLESHLLACHYAPKYWTDLNENEFSDIIADNGTCYALFVNLGVKIEFRCVHNLLPLSLKELGDMVNVRISGLNDIDAIIETGKKALRLAFAKHIDGVTIAASAYRNWKKRKIHFANRDLLEPTDPHVCKLIDMSMRGGLCLIKKSGKIYHNVIEVDRKSSYPAEMYTMRTPCKDPIIADRPLNNFIYMVHVVITHGKIRDGFIPFLATGTKILGTYEYDPEFYFIELCLWAEEWEQIKCYYDLDYKIINYINFYSRTNIFNDYISEWFSAKQNAKSPAHEQIAKLMLNSLSGKFGTDSTKKQKHLIDGQRVLVDAQQDYYYRAIASRIWSLGRVSLVRAIQANRDRFLYCDTDSVFLNYTAPPKGIKIGKNLGEWEIKGTYEQAKFLKPKVYGLQNGETTKIVCAGVSKARRKDISLDALKVGLTIKNARVVPVKVKGGAILVNQDFTIY